MKRKRETQDLDFIGLVHLTGEKLRNAIRVAATVMLWSQWLDQSLVYLLCAQETFMEMKFPTATDRQTEMEQLLPHPTGSKAPLGAAAQDLQSLGWPEAF